MRRLSLSLTLAAVLLCWFQPANAQSESEHVITNMEQSLKDKKFSCERAYVHQGEPGPDTPRGTKYAFKCKQDSVDVNIFILYGDAKADAEKSLDQSQKFLSINMSKPLGGYGEQAYESGRDHSAWITFRKGRVFAHITVGLPRPAKSDASLDSNPTQRMALLEVARSLALALLEPIPAAP